MRKTEYLLLFIVLLLAAGCRKEVEKLVVQEVDKQYSWTAVKRLEGTQNMVIGMGYDATHLFLQEPYFMGFVTPHATGSVRYVEQASANFPTDISLRLPLGSTFVAQPVRDTLVQFFQPTPANAVTAQSQTYLSLHRLDARATGIVPNTRSWLPFAAISRHNYLLFGYYTAANDLFMRFVLAQVTRQPNGLPGVQARTLTIPLASLTVNNYLRWVIAIDDYFLVNCGNTGLYKIKEDGTVKKVFAYSSSDIAYKWQGNVYVIEQNALLRSSDDGETWQRYGSTPDAFTFSTCHLVGDSLVGVTHEGGSNSLFTLRWNGLSYHLRLLKNDGIGQVAINDLQQLGDTVYLGTSGGLFKRSISKFFESKP